MPSQWWGAVRSVYWKWTVGLALAVLLALASAWVSSDNYTRAEVDFKVETVQDMHDRDMRHTKDQIDRIDGNVQMLVDHLLEGEN